MRLMAEITREVEYKFNLGNYEHVLVKASVHLTDADLPDGENNVVDLLDFAYTLLDAALAPDFERASEITACEESASIVLVNKEPITKGKA